METCIRVLHLSGQVTTGAEDIDLVGALARAQLATGTDLEAALEMLCTHASALNCRLGWSFDFGGDRALGDLLTVTELALQMAETTRVSGEFRQHHLRSLTLVCLEMEIGDSACGAYCGSHNTSEAWYREHDASVTVGGDLAELMADELFKHQLTAREVAWFRHVLGDKPNGERRLFVMLHELTA